MKNPNRFAICTMLLLTAPSVFAKEVDLPAPVLKWSVYILLIFAALVALGTFFRRRRNGESEKLGTLLASGSRQIHSVNPEITVTECVRRMNEARIGAMLVMEDDRLVGIFTERDAIQRVLGGGLDPSSTKVSEVMSRDPVSVTPATSIEEARSIVTNRRIRHLPVVDNGKVLGMISSGDIHHWLGREQAAGSAEPGA